MNRRLSKLIVWTMAGGLAFSVACSFVPDGSLSLIAESEFIAFLSGVFPAIPRSAQVSAFPNMTKVVLALNLGLFPIVFVLLQINESAWRTEVQAGVVSGFLYHQDRSPNYTAIAGIAFLFLTVLSDIFGWRFPSVLNGLAFSHAMEGNFGAVMNRSQVLSGVTYWVWCQIPPFAYYLVSVFSLAAIYRIFGYDRAR